MVLLRPYPHIRNHINSGSHRTITNNFSLIFSASSTHTHSNMLLMVHQGLRRPLQHMGRSSLALCPLSPTRHSRSFTPKTLNTPLLMDPREWRVSHHSLNPTHVSSLLHSQGSSINNLLVKQMLWPNHLTSPTETSNHLLLCRLSRLPHHLNLGRITPTLHKHKRKLVRQASNIFIVLIFKKLTIHQSGIQRIG